MRDLSRPRSRWVLSFCMLGSLVFAQLANADIDVKKGRDGEHQDAEHNRADNKPTYSAPIALSKDNSLLWIVNPDTDTVSVIRTDTYKVLATIETGDEPRSVALTPDNKYAYIANALGNSVTVLKIRNAKPDGFKASLDKSVGSHGAFITGAAPRSVVVSPDGKRVFVANSGQDTVTVVDTNSRRMIGSVDLRNSMCNVGDSARHFQPRSMAVTQDSKSLYVTRFLSYTHSNGVQRDDNGKEGVVCRIDIDTDSHSLADYAPTAAVQLQATDAGVADRAGNATSAFPNQLQSIVIRGEHAYLPNIAASPTGPQRFDTNTQAYVNRIDGIGSSETDAGAINLHLGGHDPEAGKQELYFANPWGIAFTGQSGAGDAYVISAGSDLLVKLKVDEDGVLGFTVDDDTTRYIDLNNPDNPATSDENAGKNPVGIVINDTGTTAYISNYVSRNVSVVDLKTDSVVAVVATAALPEPGGMEEVRQVGAEMFFSSRGNFVRPAGARGSSRDRLSEKGRQNCASCHSDGLTDGVIWQFASGPRKTIAVSGTFDPKDHRNQRIINASAVFDEVEDADFNTRLVSSPGVLGTPRECRPFPPTGETLESVNDPDHGLVLGEWDNFEFAPCVMNQFAKPNTNRPQPRVQLPGSSVMVNAHDALIEWQRSSVKAPARPMTKRELKHAQADMAGGLDAGEIKKGERLFSAANCQACHGGSQWTKDRKDFVSPPSPDEIATEAGAPNANQAQFLTRFLTDIGSYNLNVAGRGNRIAGYPMIGGIEKDTNNRDALGYDYNGDGKGSGFTSPSLLGTYSLPPYYHNGACETLGCVVADVHHRTAGLADGQTDPLDTPQARETLVQYLETIDEQTEPHDSGAGS